MKRLQTILALLGLAVFIAGCGDSAAPKSDNNNGGGSGKKLKLAFVVNNSADFWTIARAGTAEAEKALGDVSVEFQIPGGGTAAEQRKILDDLLAKGVDGIAVSPIDAANQTEFLNRVARLC